MATNRRDIELLISARETTGRSFKQVTDNIAALNAKIEEQTAAAERGEISLQELRRTQQELAQAGRDLTAIQSQIDAYTKLAGATDALAAKADKAKTDLDAFKNKLAESESTTERQEAKLSRLEAAVVKTGAAFEKNQTDLAEQIAVLQRAGVATDNLEQAQLGIVNTARSIGAGLTQVNSAIDGYAANVDAAKTRESNARREAADAAKLETREKRLALAQQTVDQQEATNRQVALLNDLREAEQRLAQQNAFDKKIADAQRLGDASRFVQLFAESVRTVQAAENQLSALSGFRAVGQAAVEASNDISRFVTAGQSMSVTSARLADGLRAIVDPGGAALQTIKGVEAAIESADTSAAEGVKNVGLLNDAYNNLAQAAAALLRQGSLIDTFREQEAATAGARQQFEQAQAEVQRLGLAMAQADKPTEELARSLTEAERRLTETGRALTQEETKLGELSRGLRQAEINTGDLAGEQARLEAAATRASGAMERINTTLGRGGRQTNGLFGLKPNDLANLSFQLNDIFVSLASGQNPFIVLIQQGSQIGQLFPGIISTVARFALAWSPVILAVAAVGLGFRELYTDAERLKKAVQDLAVTPGGGALDPQRYAAAQEKLEDLGAEAEKARKVMLDLVEQGFTIDQIESYSKAAGQLAERLGIEVTEAAQQLIDVQQGGIETVYELAERTNDLTDADLDHAEALFAAGRAAEARQYVLDRVAERNDQIAKATRSQWTPAVDNLKLAWQNFVGFLDRTFRPFIDGINKAIQDAVIGLTWVTALLAGKGTKGALADARAVFDQQRGRGPKAPGAGASDQSIRDRQFKADLEDEYNVTKKMTAEKRLQLAEDKARAKAQAAGVSKAVEELAVTKARSAEQSKINDEAEKASKRGSAAAKRAQREADAAQRKIDTLQNQLTSQIRQLDQEASRGPSATLESRLDAINDKYAKIADTIQKLKGKGLTTAADGTSLTDLTARVEATKQRLKDEETIKFYQEQAALLEKQRAAEIERVTDAQKRGALTTKEAVAQAAEINGRLSPQIVKAAQQALAIARAIAGTNPSPEMVSWIASLERIINGEATNRIVADVGVAGLEDTSAKLDKLTKERDELVRSYQVLNELGLQTDAETRQAVAAAYQSQGAAMAPVIAQLREQVELLHNTRDALTGLPILSDTAYATWQAKLDAVNAGLKVTDERIVAINQAAMNGIAQGVTNAFNTVGSAIAGLITGTKSWGDALNSVLNAGLSLVGSFLKAIADVLVQMLALKVAKSLIGGSGGGFGSFFFHDGGVVGKGGASIKKVSTGSGSWLNAPKFHGGGGLGLKPDEYKAVLKRGEEVLTEDNPRHINNVGKGGGDTPSQPIKQVLLFDPSQVASAMQGRAGQKTMLTFIRENKETIKQVLG